MDKSPNRIKDLAQSTRWEVLAGEPLRSAATAIEAEEEDDLVRSLVDLLEAEIGNRPDAIRATMSLLEQSIERDPPIAGRLMASLYSLASDSFLHEVCDAIDIWFYEYRSGELADAFRRKAARDPSGHLARKYLEWATLGIPTEGS